MRYLQIAVDDALGLRSNPRCRQKQLEGAQTNGRCSARSSLLRLECGAYCQVAFLLLPRPIAEELSAFLFRPHSLATSSIDQGGDKFLGTIELLNDELSPLRLLAVSGLR